MLEPYHTSNINQRLEAPEPLDEEEYYVQCIAKVKYDGRRKALVYFIKWEGYPTEQGTWLPEEELLVEGEPITALEDFRKIFPKAEEEALLRKKNPLKRRRVA